MTEYFAKSGLSVPFTIATAGVESIAIIKTINFDTFNKLLRHTNDLDDKRGIRFL